MPYIEINGEQMMQCDYCGNIWDGCAQCNCWKWIDYDADANEVAEDANANEVTQDANANEVTQDATEEVEVLSVNNSDIILKFIDLIKCTDILLLKEKIETINDVEKYLQSIEILNELIN
jgi:hypothetical protein